MLKIIKLHRNYLFNKLNIIILISFIFITFLLCMVLVNLKEAEIVSWFNRDARRFDYQYAFMFFVKIMMIFIGSFLFIMFYNKTSDNYYLLFASYYKREYFFITKLITIFLYLFLILLILCLVYIIYLTTLVYGSFSLVLCRIWDSFYVLVIPICFFFLGEIVQDMVLLKEFSQYVQMFFPSVIMENTITVFYNTFQIITILSFYSILGFISYMKK